MKNLYQEEFDDLGTDLPAYNPYDEIENLLKCCEYASRLEDEMAMQKFALRDVTESLERFMNRFGCGEVRDIKAVEAARSTLSASAQPSLDNKGIKAHDGQKLLVQHILDNDKGLSDSSRMILEKLIEE